MARTGVAWNFTSPLTEAVFGRLTTIWSRWLLIETTRALGATPVPETAMPGTTPSLTSTVKLIVVPFAEPEFTGVEYVTSPVAVLNPLLSTEMTWAVPAGSGETA